MIDKKHCSGCRDDYYNHAPMGLNVVNGEPQCWSLKTAKLVMRKRVHISQVPPWTQPAEKLPNCYKKPQFVFVEPGRTK